MDFCFAVLLIGGAPVIVFCLLAVVLSHVLRGNSAASSWITLLSSLATFGFFAGGGGSGICCRGHYFLQK